MGGAVAVDLLAQVHGKKRRDCAASDLIGASLDLLVATWPRRGRPALRIETLSNATWRISSLYYTYLPADDDSAIGACIRLARSSDVAVILPRRHEELKRRLLIATLRRRAPCIWSFDAFISWRTTSAEIDQGWPRERPVLELLAAYNRRADAAGRGDLLRVDVPTELP
jgi:hypothetical protein